MIEIDDRGFYVTSDWHLFHANIIKYCNRPFKDVEEMNKTLFENWNDVIGEDDVVFFLGDFLFGRNGNAQAKLIWDNLIAGKKYFILGNHDKRIKNFSEDVITEHWHDTIDVKYKNETFTMSHYPLTPAQFSNKYLLHGHTHNNDTSCQFNTFNCCAEMTDYKPIHIDEVLKRIERQNSQLKL